MKRAQLVKILLTICLFICIQSLYADRFIVTNTNTTGDGSLDAAIEDANNHAGADTIVFHLNEGVEGHDADVGVWFFHLTGYLSILNDDSTFIDGSSQAVYIDADTNPGPAPEIVIDGGAGTISSGLTLNCNGSRIHQICMVDFDTQISIHGDQNRVTGCFIGVDFSGHQAGTSSYTGIRFDYQAAQNVIGGELESERNIISGNNSRGITFIRQSEYNQVLGNFIGLNSSGSDAVPNGKGLKIEDGSHHNTIGPNNVISGNNNQGIYIYGVGTDSNVVIGNFIGTDPEGMLPMGNDGSGVGIDDGASNNIIGGLAPGDGNVICDNSSSGISLYGEGVNHNVILGNYIGVNITGVDTVGNQSGVFIKSGGQHNTIGPGNVISGNQYTGITIMHSGTNYNRIIGNMIGTDKDGLLAKGHAINGITISLGASFTVVGGSTAEERNIISASGSAGINISGTSTVTDSTQIMGNYIGTDITGAKALPNMIGISLANQNITNTRIGGLEEGQENLISGNGDDGIYITGTSITNNRIEGNKIGTDMTGVLPVPNQGDGIFINNGPSQNIFRRNIIAFNGWNGFIVYGSDTYGNTITRNSIYSNTLLGINNFNQGNLELEPPEITALSSVSGTAPPNSKVEIFTGPDDEGKTFLDSVWADESGNFYWDGNPAGPFVTATATDAAGNTSEFSEPWHLGPFIVTTTSDTGDGSLRWAMEQADQTAGPDSIHFQIPISDENYDAATGAWTIQPESKLPYIESDGLVIDGFSQADFHNSDTNPLGPEIELDGSLMGIYYSGIYVRNADDIHLYGLTINQFGNYGINFTNANQCRISGCYVGIDPTGMKKAANRYGILLYKSKNNQIIPYQDYPNLISGNTNFGIALDDTSTNNVISGNIIGLNQTLSDTIPNGNYGGIRLFNQADSNEVKDNRICGNRWGIYIYESSDNIVKDNFIGTNEAWDKKLGNEDVGIMITADTDSANGNFIQGNTIGYNRTRGVKLTGPMVLRNYLTRNLISRNGWSGIQVYNGANANISPPTILSATETQITGSANPGETVEVYSDTSGQGQEYLGTKICDGSGQFTLDLTSPPTYQFITATAIDAKGNTSQFSVPLKTGIETPRILKHPDSFSLMQNYPNPFNPETTIRFGLHVNARVRLKIYNVKGQEIRTIVDKKFPPGFHDIKFNAVGLPSGIYFYRIQINDILMVRKMIILD